MNPAHVILATAVFAFSAVSAARLQLSLYALDLGAGASDVGFLNATYFIFPLLLAWPIGRAADRIGSRGLLLLGLATGVVGMIIPFAIHKLYALYAAGLLIGMSFAFSSVLVLNVMGLLSRPDERARNFANVSLTGSTSNIVGPLIAGFAIDHAGHAIASLCSAGLSLVGLVLLAAWGKALPGPSGAARAAASRTSLRERLSDRAVISVVTISCLMQAGADLYSFYLPIYGHSLGLSASSIGVIMACFFVAAFAVRVFLPQLITRVGDRKLLTYAMFIAALGFALLPLFEHPYLLGVVSFGFGMGMGCGQPITMMLLFNSSPEGRSGETVALRQTANNIARVIVPPVFGFIAATTGLWSVFMLGSLMMGVGGWSTRSGSPGAQGRGS